jgi:GNAT superfamily N-acetyltransferase
VIEVIEAQTPGHFDAVRRLCWAYRDFLLSVGPESAQITETFYPEDQYTTLMGRLESEHARPDGAVKLALQDGRPVGCGMSHRIGSDIAEIKRVFVTTEARGTGAGYELMQALIDQCRDDGYRFIRMDTGKTLKPAIRLYLSLGFVLREAYYEVPPMVQAAVLFFEMDLTAG